MDLVWLWLVNHAQRAKNFLLQIQAPRYVVTYYEWYNDSDDFVPASVVKHWRFRLPAKNDQIAVAYREVGSKGFHRGTVLRVSRKSLPWKPAFIRVNVHYRSGR